MRKTKFRAWDKVNKKMLWKFLISSDGELFMVRNPMTPQGDDFGMTDMIPCREDVVLMQYTGLKDKPGNEIYEGDIIQWEETGLGPIDLRNHVVTYSTNDYKSGFDFGRSPKSMFVKVIGNVYENSELLEETP